VQRWLGGIYSPVTAKPRRPVALKTVQIDSKLHAKLVAFARDGGFKLKSLVEKAIQQTYILE
jgi:predicted HicB family RNase H-like nuclease